MTQVRKHLLAGITALGLLAGALGVHAAAPEAGGPMTAREYARNPEQVKERYAKRQAQLHDKLQLTPGQEGAWNSFTEKMAPSPRPAGVDRAEMEKLPAPERMERMLAMMQEREKRMTARFASVKEFYAILTPEQQKIFNEEFGRGRHHRPH